MKKYQYLASWDDQTLTRVGEPVVVLGDSNVSQVEVILPSNFLLDPTGAVARMYFLLPGEKESGFETLETATKDDNGDSHVTWTIKHVHSQKGGRLAFSLTLIGDDAQWDSRTAIIPVYESRYQPESEEAEEPYTGRLDALEGSMASIRGEFTEVQEAADEATETASAASAKVDSAITKADAVDERLDNIIIESGTSEAEVVAARTNSDTGTTYNTLGARLDTENSEIKEDLSPLKKIVPWGNFGTTAFPGGWRTGYYLKSTGNINSTNKNAICLPATVYLPPEGLKKFNIKVPDGYSVLVSEYNVDTGYIGATGSTGSAGDKVSSVTIVPKENSYYKFSVGWFEDGSAEQHLDTSFTEQIVLTEEYYVGFSHKKHLNILLFGNSYFADSWAFVPFILKKYGITCNIHFYYRGSGSIDRLVAEWEDSGKSGLDDFGVSHVRRYAHIDTRYFRAWEQNADYVFSPKQVLNKANDLNFDWDIIVLSSGSRSQSFTVAPGNGDPRKGAEPYIRQAIDLINETYHKTYHLAWFGLYTSIDGYAGNPDKGYPAITPEEMDNRVAVLKSTETIMGAEPFDFVIPAGSAVFNARTNASLASTTLSATGNLWCSDRVHLQAGIPNYIVNCAVVQSIFNKFYPHLSILGDDTRVTDALVTKYACPFITSWCGSVMDSTEQLYELGQKAAFMACKYPYDITPIYLPTDDTALAWFDSHSDRYWADALITRPADT